MKNRYILAVIIILLSFITMLSGCARESVNHAPEEPVINALEEETDISENAMGSELDASLENEPNISDEVFPWKIAIITNSGDEEEYRSVERLTEMVGEERVTHRTALPAFGWFDWGPIIEEIAGDSEIRAVVVSSLDFFLDRNGRLQSAAIDELLKMRDDIFVVYTGPISYPLSPISVAERANLIIETNYGMIGELFVMQAIEMGAETIVHYSFTRHSYVPFIANRREAMKVAAERNGISFVDIYALDPVEASTADAIVFIERDLPIQTGEFGVNTAFFGTSCTFQGAIISQVMETGAIFVQPCCISPYDGFPAGLDIEHRIPTGENQDTYLIELNELISAIDDAVDDGGMSGRIAGWAVTGRFMWKEVGFMYAVEWINGGVPQERGVICLDVLERLAREYKAELGIDSDIILDTLNFDGNELSNFVSGTIGHYVFGRNN